MILYLDTSSSYLYSALYKDEKILDSLSINLSKDLSSKALSLINEMFKKNNCFLNDLKKIIVVNGPGSFTGVRVGLTISKVLAWSLDIPIITISSLEAMALSTKLKEGYAVPMIDARRNYYYSGIFDVKNGCFILKEQYINIDVLKASFGSLKDINIVTNDEIKLDYNIIKYEPNYEEIIKIVKDREPVSVHLVDANYLKNTEAEDKRNDN